MPRPIPALLSVFLSIALAITWTPSLTAGERENGPKNFDVRDDDSKESGRVKEKHIDRKGPEQKDKKSKSQGDMKKAEKRLGDQIPGLEVSENKRTGGAEVVRVNGKAKLASGAGAANRETTLRKFLQDNADLYGLERNEINALVKSADYANPAGNMAWVRLEQRIKGKSVFRGEISAAFDAAGNLVATTGELSVGIDEKDAANEASISATEAVSIAAKSLGIDAPSSSLRVRESDGTTFFVEGPLFSEAARAELQYFPLDAGAVELSWNVLLFVSEFDAYTMIVGGEAGDVLFRKNIVDDQTQPATYSVYNDDSPGPLSPTNATPGSGIQGPAIGRTLFTLISEGPLFNNLGWITDGVNTTTGNNVDAGLDLVSPDGIDAGGRPTGSPFRVFNFPYNPAPGGTDPPTNTDYRNGEIAHMFFWSNRFHDRTYELGFTEAARNFQQDNFGRNPGGGTVNAIAGNDRVLAQGQDFSGTNNANFLTPADGTSGRMQMFIFTGPTPRRTSALDQDVLIHELTHGLSNRLHSNGNGLNNTMSGGMGEGWSDFYARVFVSTADENVNGIYAAGGYSTLQIVAGFTDNYYYGIRRFPYAVISNVGANGRPHAPQTLADIDPAQINVNDGAFPRGPIGSSTAFQVHNIGEIWANALFEVRARIITRMGFETGNQRTLQIVTDGMKLNPANPTIVQSRNSILTADCAGFAGADELDIWRGFAARGIGFSAITASSSSGTVTEAFDVPNIVIGDPVISGGSCSLNDGVADPGESVIITVLITNPFCGVTASNVVATLDGASPVNVGDIGPGMQAFAAFNFSVPVGSCGQILHPVVGISSSLGSTSRTLNLQVGTRVPAVLNGTGAISTTLPDLATTNIPINVSDFGPVGDVKVRFRATHTFVGDLTLTLIAPDGTSVLLFNRRGSSGDNFGSGSANCDGTFAVFDDAATTTIAAGVPPYNGSFRPDSPLAALTNHEMNGTWILRVVDLAGGDVGTAHCVQLEIARNLYFCCGVPGFPIMNAVPPPVITAESASPANNAADPDETVTVNLTLRNNGTGATTDLVATLQSSGGVLSPSAPQSYGVMTPLGGSATRSFTFVANGACGNTITLSLHLQDGASDLGTVSYTMKLGTILLTPNSASNPTAITIPGAPAPATSGIAAPYPSAINVSGLTGTVSKVTATLNGLTHTFPGDIDAVLVGPGGQRVILMSDAGGGTDIVGVNLTFEDGRPALPGILVSGTFAPTNIGTGDVFPSGGPVAPFAGVLSAFNGVNPNGTWNLFVVDDAGGDIGSYAGGWSLTITTSSPVCVVQDCTLTCPSDVTAGSAPNQPGANVTFAPASVSGSCGVVTSSPASGSFFPIGATLVTQTGTRGDGSTVDTCTFTVNVNDVQPPVISGLTANPSVIDSNNHKMVDVTVSYTSSDNSGVSNTCSITVTSSQPINGTGDGNTEPDWEVVDNHHVRLRAERAGNGGDRIYTITVTCVDAAGNSTSQSTQVVVPHDSGN